MIVNSKVFNVCCSSDAVARPVITNSTQFNGAYGCDWCYHVGERVEKGNGFVRCYPFREPEPETRSALTHEEDMLQAVELGRLVHGIKGPPNIFSSPNLISSVVVWLIVCIVFF